MSVQILARCLVASGWVKIPDDEEEGFYVLYVEDGNLIEKRWVGDNVESENAIVSGLRDDTSASYLPGLGENINRLVVFLGQNNALQCYAYNEEFEEWDERPFGGKWNITTNPKSKLSTCIDPEGRMVVSYQDEAGRLGVLMSMGENSWTRFDQLKGNPVLGTPQCLEVIDDNLHLFYVEKEAGIGYLVLDPSSGNWQANLFGNTKFSATIDNFMVAKDDATGSLQGYFLTDGSLWNVGEGQERVYLGKVEDDGWLVPSDEAQSGRSVSWGGYRRVSIFWGLFKFEKANHGGRQWA